MKRELIVVGDRVLVKPDEGTEKTRHGLYLPQGVTEKEKIHSGTIIKTGPGIPLPDFQSISEEPWKTRKTELNYLPIQAQSGDHAIFLRDAAIEMEFEGAKYLVIPQSAILVLVRDEMNQALNQIS
jgi:chaperonin GroES